MANGKVIESLSFDYTPAIKKLSRPDYGIVVEKTNVESTVRDYALRLGLNAKQTEDTINYIKTRINSPFAFVSFYDDALSKQILPLYFFPHPDTYRNIVFYFGQFDYLPNLQPKDPVFEPVERVGFTAVEISFVAR